MHQKIVPIVPRIVAARGIVVCGAIFTGRRLIDKRRGMISVCKDHNRGRTGGAAENLVWERFDRIFPQSFSVAKTRLA